MAQRWREKSLVSGPPASRLTRNQMPCLRVVDEPEHYPVAGRGLHMTIVYLWALLAIALSLCVLMALAWLVQQRTGNSGWVDTIWTFAVGLVGAGSALWPIAGAAPERAAMAGGGAGCDLVAAAWPAHRGAHGRHHRTIPAMRPLPKRGASTRRGACSSSCRIRRSVRFRWRLRSLLQRDSPMMRCDGRTSSAR